MFCDLLWAFIRLEVEGRWRDNIVSEKGLFFLWCFTWKYRCRNPLSWRKVHLKSFFFSSVNIGVLFNEKWSRIMIPLSDLFHFSVSGKLFQKYNRLVPSDHLANALGQSIHAIVTDNIDILPSSEGEIIDLIRFFFVTTCYFREWRASFGFNTWHLGIYFQISPSFPTISFGILSLSSSCFQLKLTPSFLKGSCKVVFDTVRVKYGNVSAENALSSFLFLNLYCPAIIFPDRFHLLSSQVLSDSIRSKLMLLSKTLFCISSGIELGEGEDGKNIVNFFEEWISFDIFSFFCSVSGKMNLFIREQRAPLHDFLMNLLDTSLYETLSFVNSFVSSDLTLQTSIIWSALSHLICGVGNRSGSSLFLCDTPKYLIIPFSEHLTLFQFPTQVEELHLQ